MTKRRKATPSNTDFLAELVLWQNNPEQAEIISQLAHQGNRDAQYALGLIYAEGRGIEEDQVQAYYWLSKAMAQGDQDAETLRQIVQQSMSFDEIRQADHKLAYGHTH
ncbi:MAG: sel1 repeat family protein [Gammaproteobacteria bacterium]|jgi:TPR repeat protein